MNQTEKKARTSEFDAELPTTIVKKRKAIIHGGIMTRATEVLLPALQQARVQRLILISAFGVGDSFNDASAFQKFFFRTILRSIYADKAKSDALIQASALQWTIVRPVALTNGPRTGKYRIGEKLKLRGIPRVSRADVADFMIRELTEGAWIRKTVVITS